MIESIIFRHWLVPTGQGLDETVKGANQYVLIKIEKEYKTLLLTCIIIIFIFP